MIKYSKYRSNRRTIMPIVHSTTWELLVSDEDLKAEAKRRATAYNEMSVDNRDLASYISKGWEIVKAGKTKTKIRRAKPIGDAFEDEIWTVLYSMGFTTLNKGNTFAVSLSDDNSLSKQIDVIAIDDEVCLFVECKAATVEGTTHDWKKDLTEIDSNYSRLCSEIRKIFPNRKCKYIFATKNYVVGEQDKSRLSMYKIAHFNNNTVLYYQKLANYLGASAKYQLLGSLFANTEIKGMDSRVPAIKGKMGGLEYYTFLIEPEKLLKMGYVLHRTNAHNDYEDLLPSYQRLIKKDRLKAVRQFIADGGYFPNSLIVSIDASRPLRFEPASSAANATAKIGTLYLPQNYQSIYVIDGQHRLYGYTDSPYAATNTIPVVAFENLDKDTQLKLFVEINENQKKVSKGLRNILEIDMFFDSDDSIKSRKALCGYLGKRLGEDERSPWYGRVVIGEDAETSKCCITLDYIKAAFEKTSFFNKYKKDKLVEKGIFDKNDNSETVATFYPFFLRYLSDLREYCSIEWNETNGYITKNNSAVALIRIFDDIVGIALEKNPSLINDYNSLYNECSEYVLALADVINNLDASVRQKISTSKGEKAKEDSYRALQMALHIYYSDFTNDRIDKYYREVYTDHKEQTKAELEIVKDYLVCFTKELFAGEENWMDKHMEEAHQKEFTTRLNNMIIAARRSGGLGKQLDPWEQLTFKDLSRIMQYSTHWSDYFKPKFEQLGIEKNKQEMVFYINSFNELSDKIKNGNSITKPNYDVVHSFYEVITKSDEQDDVNGAVD